MVAKMRRENPAVASLPIDLLSNILSRLPITTLLRLKSVSKSWHSLIATSSHFANLHLRRNNHRHNHHLLIFTATDRSLYSVNLHSPNPPPFNIRFESLRFSKTVGSCNGLLLCVCDDLLASFPSSYGVALVNPSTLSYRRIPKLDIPQNYLNVSYGFGYDSRFDDYKIVRIVYFVSGCANGSVIISWEIMVFSLRSSYSWKLIEDEQNFLGSCTSILSSRNGVLVNNHLLHWVFWCDELNKNRICSFDVCGEMWCELPMPDYIENCPVSRNNRGDWLQCDGENRKLDVLDLGVLDECLCLLTRNFRREVGNVDVWVMKEYGVKDSWFKLFVVGSELDVTGVLEVTPVAYSSSGTEILVRRDQLSRIMWYDLEAKTTRRAEIDGVPDYHGVTVCIPSLVPLHGVTGAGEIPR